MKVMKKSISLILAFVILLNVICINSFAKEVTEIPVRIPCQYIVEFEIQDGYFDGYYIDGTIYVEPSVIGMLTGFKVNEDAAEIMYVKDKPTSSFFYRLELDERKIIRHAIGSETEWDVDVRKLSNGSNVVNLEETLLAMNVQVAVSDEEKFMLCTYLPYTVYDAWREFVNHYPALFSWSEVEADRNNSDPKLEGVLSAVSQLYFEYNDHFVSDAVISWWSQDVLNATEEQFMDTMSEILLCMTKDHNKYVTDESLYNFYEQTSAEMDLVTDFIDLLEPDGDLAHVVEGLEMNASFMSVGCDILDTVNIVEQYKSIQETQRDVLKELFVNYPMYAQAKDSSSKHLYNAAKHLSQRIDDSGLGTITTISDAIIDFAVEQLGDVVSSVSPILVVLNASTTIVKNTPGLSNQIDSLAHINIGCNAWALLMLSINNYNTWVENFYNYMFPTENEMNQLRLTMLFRIMASLTARQHFILSNELSPATVAAMEQKNKELTGLYFLIEKSKTITASRDNSPQIQWNGYLETIRSDEQVSTSQKEDEGAVLTYPAEKLLTRVNYYSNNGDSIQYDLLYDNQNRLSVLNRNAIEETKYTYNDDGKLIWAIHGKPVDEVRLGENSGEGYEYNSAGQLTKEFSWEGSYSEFHHEYDSNGIRIRSIIESDLATGTYDYVYDNNGVLVCSNVFEKSNWSEETYEHTTLYDYAYKPFVIEYDNSYMSATVKLCNNDGASLFKFYVYNAQYYVDDEGYLTKIVEDDGSFYEFHYNSDTDGNSEPSQESDRPAPEHTTPEHAAPESSHTSSIFGVWDSIDGEQRMIFSSKASLSVSYGNGIQSADGTAIIIDLHKGKRAFGGFTTNGSTIILTIDMQQESLNYSLSGDSLSIGNLGFRRVEKALANQLVGTWENNDSKFTFDDEGNVTVSSGSSYEQGVYAILSESKIMFNIDDNGASTFDYSVDGKIFTLGNRQYTKDGESSDYKEVTAATDMLVGTWKSDATDAYYVFRSDGIYEYYAIESLYKIGRPTTKGLYDIASASTIKVYQDMSGGFYSEFSLTDGVLTSDTYSSSSGGYIQYRKAE